MNINFIYTNKNGVGIDLANSNDFILTDIDGLTAADINLAIATQATADGEIITNTRANARQIVVYLQPLYETNVETFKRNILSIIKPKQTGVLNYKHSGRNLSIAATVQNIEMPRFTDTVIMQITFYCAYPFWQDAQYIIDDIKSVTALHHFKLTIADDKPLILGRIGNSISRTIENAGDVAVGVVIELIAKSTVDVPKISRESDGAFMEININMHDGDVLRIDTNRGQKSAKLITNSGTINVIGSVNTNSEWLKLEPGDNTLIATALNRDAEMYLSLTYKRAFV